VEQKKMGKAFISVGVVSFVIYLVTIIVLGVQFDREISGHLELAAHANSTELAERKLKIATDGMRKRGLCNGGEGCFTSIIYRTPGEDVGYWRENIDNTLADLQSMSPVERADNLIESNQLIKVRETLLSTGEAGDRVTEPQGISRYPNNFSYGLWFVLSLCVIGLGFFVAGWEDRNYYR
jgi:hypothetical protein